MPVIDRQWFTTDRGREIGFALALLVPVGFGFAGAEWFLRARESTRAGTVDWGDLQARVGARTPDGMIRLRPNGHYGQMAINAYGYRGPDVRNPPAPRTVRIAFLGDSKVLAADQSEAATLAAQTVAWLHRTVPTCRFDYVSLSGPGYTLRNLATLWREDSRKLHPDVAVLLAGSSSEVFDTPESVGSSGESRVPQAGIGRLLARSALVRLVGREIRMVSPVTPRSDESRLPLSVLAQRHRANLATLGRAIGDTPLVAIGYRSQIGDPDAPGAPLLAARHLRQDFPGLSVAKAVAISELVVTELRLHARAAGWRFIDPIESIQHDRRYFSDRSHFSARGHAHIAKAVAAQIAPSIDAACKIDLSS